jgi:hypothetical protein
MRTEASVARVVQKGRRVPLVDDTPRLQCRDGGKEMFRNRNRTDQDQRTPDQSSGMSRRALLKSAAGSAAVGLAAAGTTSSVAQVTGIMPGGGTVPFRRPRGSLDYIDQGEYISNMEVVSHLQGARIAGGEPLMNMWAQGDQRLIAAGGSGWVDVSDPRNPSIVGASEGISGCIIYATAIDKWLMLDRGREPLTGASVEYPHGRWHKELYERVASYDGLRGIRTYDITDPTRPVLLNEFSTGESGSGTHMNFYCGGQYAYLDAGWSDQFRMENAQRAHSNGLMIVDMSDPENVREVSRWHVPGQLIGEEEEYDKYWWAGDQASWPSSHGAAMVPQRIEDGGRYGYGGWGHFGMIVFDLSDIRNPREVGRAQWDFETMGSIPYHTVYPVLANDRTPQLRNIVIGTPEPIQPDCREPYKPGQVIDVSDPRNPRVIGLFPRPKAPEDAPYNDFCLARGRFGIHNTQSWVAPGDARPELVFVSMFNAGIRVVDISEPTQPREVAWFVPPRGEQARIEEYESWRRAGGETVFVEWDRNLIWFGTSDGTYCLSCPALGAPVLERRRISNWVQPHLNRGWDG